MVGAALNDDKSWCGIIVDGHHVDPRVLNIALRAAPLQRFMLVSDAMPSVGGDKSFIVAGEEISVSEGRCVNADGTLAGSDLDMASAVRNSVSMLRVDLASQQLVAYAPLRNPELEPDPFVVYPVDLTGKDGSSRVLAASTGSKLNASVTAAAQGGASVNVRPKTPLETAADKLVHEDPGLAGPVILDADPSSQVISSKGRYVAYAKRGGVYVCPFEPVDADYLKKIVATRAKLQAMNKAKQVAVALIIYGADYDDILPPNGNWKDSVYPYLKNRDMTNGFNYILDGQNMTGIDEPANMEMGSIDTPYGRAIAYVDGHVKWVPAVAPESLYLSLFGEDRRRAGL